MDRFFSPPERWGREKISLPADESHHCARVMRKQVGAKIEVFDGVGRSVVTQIDQISKTQVDLSLISEVKESVQALQIHLCQSIPKGKNMDLVVQKAVELGVSSIQPLLSENTVVKVSKEEAVKRQEKWQRVALEACKQCGQNRLPEVKLPCSFNDWVTTLIDLKGVVASLHPGTQKLRTVLGELSSADPIGVLIGPEGDLTEEEVERVLSKGWSPVTLGDIVLRSETASIYTLSAICHQWG